MIVNIPIQISDEIVNQLVAKDYEKKIEAYLTKMVEDRLARAAGYYGNKSDGIAKLVDGIIGDCIERYKDEIVERAAKDLADRIMRRKAGKEIMNG